MPPAHVTACKGPPLRPSCLCNGTGGSGHPTALRDGTASSTGVATSEASRASEVALAPCPQAGGHPSRPPSTISPW